MSCSLLILFAVSDIIIVPNFVLWYLNSWRFKMRQTCYENDIRIYYIVYTIVMQLYHAYDLFVNLNNGVFGTKVLLFRL